MGDDIDKRIARRVQARRQELGLSLEELADRSGVSRSMLSRIERAESNPTASLLLKVCDALSLTLSGVMGEAEGRGHAVARRKEQLRWQDPASGYVRRMVSPPIAGSSLEIVEVELPAGAHVDFIRPARVAYDREIYVLAGKLRMVLTGGDIVELANGDCLHMLDSPRRYENVSNHLVRYLVVHSTSTAEKR